MGPGLSVQSSAQVVDQHAAQQLGFCGLRCAMLEREERPSPRGRGVACHVRKEHALARAERWVYMKGTSHRLCVRR